MKMQKWLTSTLLITCALLVIFQPVAAEVHRGQDVIGLTTTPDESGFFKLNDLPIGPIQLHLMVYGYEHPQGIVAWKCAVMLPDGLSLTKTTLMGRGINSRTRPWSFEVSTSDPLLPEGGMIHLATLDLINEDHSDKQVFIIPDYPWGNDGFMGFARQTDQTIRTPFNWPLDCDTCPVFKIVNTTQGPDDLAWDQVKSLFR